MDKNEFQKFVKQFRESGDKFPRAMMYGSQIRKRTATINCGGIKESKEIVDRIISPQLELFLESQNATYIIERKLDSRERVIKQIRIFW